MFHTVRVPAVCAVALALLLPISALQAHEVTVKSATVPHEDLESEPDQHMQVHLQAYSQWQQEQKAMRRMRCSLAYVSLLTYLSQGEEAQGLYDIRVDDVGKKEGATGIGEVLLRQMEIAAGNAAQEQERIDACVEEGIEVAPSDGRRRKRRR